LSSTGKTGCFSHCILKYRELSLSRPIPHGWFLRLKGASRDLIALSGGVESAATIAEASSSSVSRWQSIDSPDVMPLMAALALEAHCAAPLLSRLMLELQGASQKPEAQSVDLAGHAAALAMSSGAALAEIAQSMGDGQMTPNEASLCDKKLAALDAAMRPLRARLQVVRGPEPTA
jgi:hypothetical protein